MNVWIWLLLGFYWGIGAFGAYLVFYVYNYPRWKACLLAVYTFFFWLPDMLARQGYYALRSLLARSKK